MAKINFDKRILLGITGREEKDWQSKLADLNRLGTREVTLFLEKFDRVQTKKIYRALYDTCIKSIPLCHIRNDMEVEELVFLEAKFKTKYFTIHENSFSYIEKWPEFEKELYLEMDFNNRVSRDVLVERIGGFCVDLSHFKAAQTNFTEEFEYIYYENASSNFACNHLNGYDPRRNSDMHIIKDLKNFDYLKTLPHFIFGKVIGLETENDIQEQVRFKKYLVEMLEDIFNKKQ